MKNILNIDNGIPTLLSNVDDGTNTLYINDELVPSSEWTGTGYYTFTSGGLTFTIRKIRDTSGNIMLQLIEQSGGTSYRLIKAVSTDDKYYSIDDPAETDLADGDYVPFYDTSAGAKKKSLWSNIVDKIKTALGIESSGNTFLKKDGTWGTPIRGTFFGTCDTAADQAVKVITLSDSTGFSLLPGVVIGVKYTYTNTKLICSLNVNNTGQIRVAIGEQTPLMHNQEYMFGKAGYTTYYMYDGQYWNFLNHNGNIKDGTTYTFATGDSNGQIKVTPSGGTAQNVSVKGLGSAAYLEADKSGTANTVVQRSGYGYINAGNSATENPASYTAYPVFQDSDGWYRKATKANYRSWLGILYISSTTLTSTVSSGTEANICKLTIPSSGTYIINGQAGFTSDCNSYAAFLLRQNSTNITKIGKDKVVNSDMFNATLVKTLSANDIIYIRIYQGSGSTKTVNNVYLSAIRIE